MDRETSMFQALEELQNSDYYPFHMPGHKRNMYESVLSQAYGMDITEIDGFDNLHAPQGLILQSMELATQLYGTKKTYYLVNGSTVGILTAVYSCVKPGGKILAARNSHKALYNTISLLNLETRYLYPEVLEDWNIAGGIKPQDVRTALEQDKDIQAVLITSPTYDGIVSPVQEIADIVHKKGIPLIVDEAHGAHFLFSDKFPLSALQQGADIVIHSVHKTLPAFTQTALLHLQGNLVQSKKVERYLSMFQSSSPSYLLMGGIDFCIRLVAKEKEKLWTEILNQTDNFYKKMQNRKHIRIMYEQAEDITGRVKKDPLKLIICVQGMEKSKTPYTGHNLYQDLLEKYHLQMEMEADTYVLGILTCMDKKEGLLRLEKALTEIDRQLTHIKEDKINIEHTEKHEFTGRLYAAESITSALEKEHILVDLKDAAGQESGCFLNLYPPGIPLIVPGEVISQELVDKLIQYKQQGLTIQGLKGDKTVVVNNLC